MIFMMVEDRQGLQLRHKQLQQLSSDEGAGLVTADAFLFGFLGFVVRRSGAEGRIVLQGLFMDVERHPGEQRASFKVRN